MDWSIKEVELIVLDYFLMLSDELDGKPINKTFHRDGLKKLINRTDGSIEYKHQNISAVLAKLVSLISKAINQHGIFNHY